MEEKTLDERKEIFSTIQEKMNERYSEGGFEGMQKYQTELNK